MLDKKYYMHARACICLRSSAKAWKSSLARTHTHTHIYVICIAFPWQKWLANAPQSYVIRTLSVLFSISWHVHPLLALIYSGNSISFCRATAQLEVKTSSFVRFLDHTQLDTLTHTHTHTHTRDKTFLKEMLARNWDSRDTQHTHKRQTFMSLVGFETAIPAIEWQRTYALERPATAIGLYLF